MPTRRGFFWNFSPASNDLRTTLALARYLAESGATPDAPIGFIPRNRPSAIATLIGLIAQGRTIRMIYAFQSPAFIARDIVRLKPAVVVVALSDMTSDVRGVLAAGSADLCLVDVNPAALEEATTQARAAIRLRMSICQI